MFLLLIEQLKLSTRQVSNPQSEPRRPHKKHLKFAAPPPLEHDFEYIFAIIYLFNFRV